MEQEVWMPNQRELNRTFLSAFVDGMTCAGLFVRTRLPGALDFNDNRTIERFTQEEDPVGALQACEEGQHLNYRYAMAGLTAGTITFLGALVGFCYWVTRG